MKLINGNSEYDAYLNAKNKGMDVYSVSWICSNIYQVLTFNEWNNK